MVTQDDIARMLQLSKSTVSRILNGKTVFEDETRARVMALASELGYRHLRPTVRKHRRRTKGVALFGVLIERDPDPVIPIVATRALRGISEAARMEDVAIHVDSFTKEEMRTFQQPEQQPILLKNGQLSGLLLLGKMNVPAIRSLAEQVCCVRVNDREPELALDCVGQNDLDATEALVNHLFALGHRRIGFLTSSVDNWPFRARLAGFGMASMRLGLEHQAQSIVMHQAHGASESASWNKTHETVLKQIEKGVRAWICVHDDIGYALIKYLHDQKLRVPQDAAVCGYDNLDPSSEKLPRLTTIDWPFEEIGAAAMRRLLRRTVEPASPKACTVFNGRLLVGPSTEVQTSH